MTFSPARRDEDAVPTPRFVSGDIPEEPEDRMRWLANREHPDDEELRAHALEHLRDAYRALARAFPAGAGPSPTYPQVPRGELDAILRRAAREHPDDYALLKDAVDAQANAYVALTLAFPPDGRPSPAYPHVPREALDAMLAAAVQEWPLDYAMQQHALEQQVHRSTP